MQSYEYDLMDRVIGSRTVGQGLTASPALVVVKGYDEEGNLTRVERRSEDALATNIGSVVNQYEYDAAGRKTADIAPSAPSAAVAIDKTFYDPAGNVDSVRTRRGHKLTMTYDAANHLKRKEVDGHTEPEETRGIPTHLGPAGSNPENPPYPRYPSPGSTGYVIPEVTTSFSYDELGRITVADNDDAHVRRGYLPNGLLAAETTYVRTVNPTADGTDFQKHTYIVGYTYDLNGRRTELRHPSQLAPVVGSTARDLTRYTYSPETGELSTVRDPLGKEFSYEHDFGGRVTRLWLPWNTGTSTVSSFTRRIEYAYDHDGNETLDQVRVGFLGGSEDPWRRTLLTYDARGKVTRSANAFGPRDVMDATYNGLGHVTTNSLVAHGKSMIGTDITHQSTEGFATDALGNATTVLSDVSNFYANGHASTWGERQNLYESGTGRLLRSSSGRIDTTAYDAAGNVIFTWQPLRPAQNTLMSDRYSYYDAEGRLRAADHRRAPALEPGSTVLTTVFEEYRYDALGRRVLVRSRRFCRQNLVQSGRQEDDECKISFVRRTVWDGEQELYEIQMPEGGAEMENDTTLLQARPRMINGFDPNLFFGRVAYTHGLALDQPLGITRINYRRSDGIFFQPFTIVPIWNSRGQPDMGFIADGTPLCVQPNDPNCVQLYWPAAWSVYGVGDLTPLYFHGSLLHAKRDKAGTLYRRNRQYDPATGRFTQEDPIGLAGGLNLYGFAGGDPVNFGDPLGLCPEDAGGDGKTSWLSDCPKGTRGYEMWNGANIVSAEISPFDLIPVGTALKGIWSLVTAIGEEAVENAAKRLIANKIAGDAFRDEIAELFKRAGYQVRTEVTKRTPFGVRRIDIEVSRGGRVLGGIETKTGRSRYTAAQRAKDKALKLLENYTVDVVR